MNLEPTQSPEAGRPAPQGGGWSVFPTSINKPPHEKEGNAEVSAPPSTLATPTGQVWFKPRAPAPVFAAVTAADVRQVVADHPEYRFDKMFPHSPERTVKEVELALKFLRGRYLWMKAGLLWEKLRSAGLKHGRSAYSLKHRAERDEIEYLGYVSEGAFIVAAIMEGFEHRPTTYGLHAVVYRMAQRNRTVENFENIPPDIQEQEKLRTGVPACRRAGVSPNRRIAELCRSTG